VLAFQGPELVRVGRVTVVYWPETELTAIALAERSDPAGRWPGLEDPQDFPFRLVVTPNQHVFDSVTAGRVPGWGAGATFPATNTIVLVHGGNIEQVWRHEMAHLTVRNAVGRVPLWFDEGYASRAAGEWSRLEALRVNWSMVRGEVPSLIRLNRQLRSGAASARASYALATTAVLFLERLGQERGLSPLMQALAETSDLDRALRRTYGLTLDQFEGHWREELRKRYGWLLLATSFSVFWSVVAVVLLGLWARRRRRDRLRRARLDEGWVVLDGGDFPTS
jgi:hypothetical protein